MNGQLFYGIVQCTCGGTVGEGGRKELGREKERNKEDEDDQWLG